MATQQRYRLKLSRLDFISPVDEPAQQTAKVCLIKRAKGERVALTAQVAKIVDELGLVFGWAFTSQIDGVDYFDLQGDAIDQDFIKAAADFMAGGALTDEMHDGEPDGRVVFAMPMTPEIATAFGVTSKTVGLMVALKPSTEVLAKFKSGEYTGFSIAGMGERAPVDKGKAQKRGYDPDKRSAVCKAKWTTAYIDDLPDSSFLYVEDGGKKDDSGKTTPRSLRFFPYKDENGKIDIDHLRDAIGRIPQSSLSPTLRNKLQVKAEKLLAAQHMKALAKARLRKDVVLTNEVDGHQHGLDLDDPADWCGDKLSTTYATSEGADTAHAHVWMFDPKTGAVTIGADSGHTHTVDGVVPPEVLAAFTLNEQAEDARDAQALLERVLDGDAGASAVNVTIAARASQTKSTPEHAVRTVKHRTEEQAQMDKDAQIADLKKQLAKAFALAVLSDAQRAHHAKLSAEDGEKFLAKSATERDAVLAEIEKANEVVYTSTTDGTVYRKSDDKRLVEMAKRQDAQTTELAKARADRETEILKREVGEKFPNLAGTVDAKVTLLKAVAGIADEKVRGEIAEILTSANAAMGDLTVAKGINPGAGGEITAQAIFDAKLAEFAKAKNKSPQMATSEFIATPEGADLYRIVEADRIRRITGQAGQA